MIWSMNLNCYRPTPNFNLGSLFRPEDRQDGPQNDVTATIAINERKIT